MNSDFVFVDGMELSCRVGITPEEKAFPQILRVSIRIFLPLMKAGGTDSLQDTIDYAEVIQRVRVHTGNRIYMLVETIAEDIADLVLASPKSMVAEVEVRKKVFEGIEAVGAFIRREKKTS
jgi:dihydroneopterin aldolase